MPWADGKNQLTLTLQWFLAGWAKELSWKAVAAKFRVSWDSVFRSVEMAVVWGLTHRDLEDIRSIGVDEIAHSNGHKYFTLVYQIDKGMKRSLYLLKPGKSSSIFLMNSRQMALIGIPQRLSGQSKGFFIRANLKIGRVKGIKFVRLIAISRLF